MFGWLKELYDINHERRLNHVTELDSKNEVERTVCASCETLKMQLAIANQHNERLLDKLLTPPVVEVSKPVEELKPVPMSRNHTSWAVARQMKEENDRAIARIEREKDKEIESSRTAVDAAVDKVEQELGIKL